MSKKKNKDKKSKPNVLSPKTESLEKLQESLQIKKEELSKLIQEKESKLERTLKGDKDAKEKELSNIQQSIDSLEKELKEMDTSKISKVSHGPINIQFPDEALPKIGELYRDKQERFLVISFWEDLEEGKIESKRLNAILCINKKQESQNKIHSSKNNESDVW